jgi:hypothetical protein
MPPPNFPKIGRKMKENTEQHSLFLASIGLLLILAFLNMLVLGAYGLHLSYIQVLGAMYALKLTLSMYLK